MMHLSESNAANTEVLALLNEYSAPERASRPDELSTVTAAVVQFAAVVYYVFAPLAHRALPGPGVYRFGFSGKAGALTRKGNVTQRVGLPTKPRIDAYVAFRRCIILRSGVRNTFI